MEYSLDIIIIAFDPEGMIVKKRIVLISCVSKKLPQRSKAKDLYISTLFKLSLKYAEKLAPDTIFILSAKYGLLALDQEIEPYEQTLNKMRNYAVRAWANSVFEEIRNVASDTEGFEWLSNVVQG